jgi:hypothetical protein
LHFVEMAGLHQVERRTAAQVLHNDPQFRLLTDKEKKRNSVSRNFVKK